MLRTSIAQLFFLSATTLLNPFLVSAEMPGPDTVLWLESSLQRVFPNSTAGTKREITLEAARNYTVSFQACIRNQGIARIQVKCTAEGTSDIGVHVRRVGFVPVLHHNTNVPFSNQDGIGSIPGLVPDPLFPDQRAAVGPGEDQPFWVTVKVPADAQPGLKSIKLLFEAEETRDNQPQKRPLGELSARIDVHPLVLRARENFPVTHWWYPDAIYDWYKIDAFGERWWELMDAYLRDMAEHGSNMVVVPLFHIRPEMVVRPPQLLKVKVLGEGKYGFDFSGAHRFVQLAKKTGMSYYEFPHLWGPSWGKAAAGVQNPVNVYAQEGDRYTLIWPQGTTGSSDTYAAFLRQFLPALHEFLVKEDILEHSYFHIADEPHGDEQFHRYQAARALLRQLAPWMRTIDALSEVRYGSEGVTDVPVPLLPAAQKYSEAGIPHWVYFCTAPRGTYLNRLMDTPLTKVRMSGMLFYRLGAKGFLHWGYNYWYKMSTGILVNPFEEAAGGNWPGIPYGDTFVVYPGPDGPIDSLRWEVFAESLQDYALLQTDGVPRDSSLLSEIKTYEHFPESEKWIDEKVNALLNGPR